jgi:phage-related protein
LVSVLNGIWISVIHATYFSLYIKNNPEMMAGYQQLPQGISPRAMMLIVGPIIGVVTGVIAGLLALIAAKIVRRNPAEA